MSRGPLRARLLSPELAGAADPLEDRARIFDGAPGDPLLAAGAALALLVVTMIASWIPARRAVRVDPAVALRSD